MANLRGLIREKSEAISLGTLVANAASAELELLRLQGQDGQLTARAYLAATEAVPGTSAQEADAIEKALQGPESALLGSSFRLMAKAIREFRRSSPILKISAYIDPEADSALARLGATRQSLFLVAARDVTRTQPQLFGEQESPGAWDAAITKALAERDRLFAAIDSYPLVLGVDTTITAENADGWLLITYKITNDEVRVTKDRAQHLVKWWQARAPEAKAA